MLKKFVLGGMVVVAALLGNACGGDDSSDSSPVLAAEESSSSVDETLSSSTTEAPSSSAKDKESSSSVKSKASSSSEKSAKSSSSKDTEPGDKSSSSAKVDESSSSVKSAESSSSVKVEESSSSEKNEISSSSEKPVESSGSEKGEESYSSVKPDESSSSIFGSSSSAVENSSSSLEVSGVCKTELEDHCTYDSLYDERDGQTYKTVKIGEQWWMAENLRYEDAEQSVCYTDNPDNCLIYGKLYTRNGAINDCPNGWHLPTEKEWLKLQEYIKENSHSDKNNVGQYLRADSLWDVSGLGVGYDAFGFSALPAGVKDHDGWWGLNTHTHFWLSDSWKNGSDNCYVYVLIRYKLKDDSDMKIGKNGKICDLYPSSKYSVRCIKD